MVLLYRWRTRSGTATRTSCPTTTTGSSSTLSSTAPIQTTSTLPQWYVHSNASTVVYAYQRFHNGLCIATLTQWYVQLCISTLPQYRVYQLVHTWYFVRAKITNFQSVAVKNSTVTINKQDCLLYVVMFSKMCRMVVPFL